MFQPNVSAYAKTGLLAGIATAVVTNVVFWLLGLLFDHDTSLLGQDRDTLYFVFVTFASFVSVFLGSILFYFFQKGTEKPVLWLAVVVIIGLVVNTFSAQVNLAEEYRVTAHILHMVVGMMAVYLIPKYSKR